MLLFANNATTEVAGPVSETDTQINVVNGGGVLFPNPGPGDYFVVTLYKNDASQVHEIIHVYIRNGDTMTVVRGRENTLPQPWNSGDTFSALITAGMLGLFDQGGVSFGPENLVYVGQDTGGPNVVVVPILSPVIGGGLVEGMTFNIMIAANNSGPTNVTMNGFPTYPAKRLDGTDLVAGDLTGGQMMKMWFDGAQFTLPLQNVPIHPPKDTTGLSVFYVDANNGDDSDDGLTWGSAFKTGPGAITAIETRYASQAKVELRFADGTYREPINILGGYISRWRWVGNVANPAACLIDVRNPVAGTPNATGIGMSIGTGAHVLAEGFKVRSHQENYAIVGGSLSLQNCMTSPPITGEACIFVAVGAGLTILNRHTHDTSIGPTSCAALIEVADSALVGLAYEDPLSFVNLDIHHIGPTPTFTSGYVYVANSGVLSVDRPRVKFYDSLGVEIVYPNATAVLGPRHNVGTGGGIYGLGSVGAAPHQFFPGSVPGTIDTATFGWIV